MFRETISAFTDAWIAQWDNASNQGYLHPNQTVLFIVRQTDRMPDHFRLAFHALTYFFSCSTFLRYLRPFHSLKPEQRLKVIQTWQSAPLSFMRDYIRLMVSLIVIHREFLHSEDASL